MRSENKLTQVEAQAKFDNLVNNDRAERREFNDVRLAHVARIIEDNRGKVDGFFFAVIGSDGIFDARASYTAWGASIGNCSSNVNTKRELVSTLKAAAEQWTEDNDTGHRVNVNTQEELLMHLRDLLESMGHGKQGSLFGHSEPFQG